MKRTRSYVLCAMPLLICGIFLEFLPETFGLAWHAVHGRTTILGRFEIPVPTLWWVAKDEGGWHLMLSGFPGRFRALHLGHREWASMSFSVAPNATTGVDQEKITPKVDALLGMQTVSISKIMIADQSTLCFEKRDKRFEDVIQINCVPEAQLRGISANYMGHRKFTEMFFVTLRSAKTKSVKD